ncbi:hypothetical protein Barb4_01477 [Bacteroidales bacterium Barb4]|nr:hypothetical protein Barb4_01477 [Bacteroidales bacterium Barb4]
MGLKSFALSGHLRNIAVWCILKGYRISAPHGAQRNVGLRNGNGRGVLQGRPISAPHEAQRNVGFRDDANKGVLKER